MTTLYDANNQWRNRPDDQRFENLVEMAETTQFYAKSAVPVTVDAQNVEIKDTGDNVALRVGEHEGTLTNYAFGQLARMMGAPPEYLRKLPSDLVQPLLRNGLAQMLAKNEDKALQVLFHRAAGRLVTRCITSESYDRVWDYEVIQKLCMFLSQTGWRVPPARPAFAGQSRIRKATEADILPNQGDFGLSVKVGDDIAPAGLYASDHDMFAFMVNTQDPVWDGQKFSHKGVMVQNSEVGDKALKLKLFLFDAVCGNHYVFGAKDIKEVNVRHVKGKGNEESAPKQGNTLTRALHKWIIATASMPSGDAMSNIIKRAREYEIAATKDQVLDAVLGFAKKHNLNRLGKGVIEGAYEIAERTPRYGNPNTPWALTSGLTEMSQNTSFTDDRTEMDTQAGQILGMAG